MRRPFIPCFELRPFEPLLESATDHVAVGKLDVDFAPAGLGLPDGDHPSDIARLIAKARWAEFSPSYPGPDLGSHGSPKFVKRIFARILERERPKG